MIDDPHGDRMVGVSIFPSKTITTPHSSKLQKWHKVRSILMCRTVRTQKDGPLIGGYLTDGHRCDANVETRSLVQLDIDTKTKTDKATGEVQILKSAPVFDDIRNRIDQFEYVAASTHSHDPARGLVKYRITLLPDREIEREEHQALLEAFNALLGGCLDRDAWAWSQAFYLPSCAPERAGDAFAVHNAGALIPVDEFVEQGRRILTAKAAPAGNVATGPRPIPEPETAEAVARVRSMLDAIDPDVDRRTWRQACWAVLATGWDCAEGLIREWSERGEKFEETDFAKVVDSFDPARGTSVGTLVYIARQHGWQDLSATAEGQRDIVNGQRFAKTFRNRLLYLADDESWLVFDPEIGWQPAPYGEADRAAKSIVEEMQAEARTKPQMTEVSRASLLRNLRAMIEMAKSEPGMSAKLSDFDTEPMVIGLQNGIFDLDKWECELPTPERKVSKRANVAYDPGAKCPQFLKFLKEVQPDPEVRRLLRAWFGYCLTGRVDEHVFFYFYGDGRNGKTTFIETIAWVLGDYARKIPTEMLMSHKRNPQGASPDILLLKGVRLAYANETEEGKRLDEAVVKDLTGGDTLTGRGTYAKEFTEFQPTHKLTIRGNHLTEVRDNSTGMWDRVILVLFDVTIEKKGRDRRLGNKLKAEGAGIFNWLLAGLADYKTNGLTVPKAIQAATAAYRTEQDIIGEWIADRCVSRAEMEATLGAPWLAAELAKLAKWEGKLEAELKEDKHTLYSDYDNWARTSGYMPVSKKNLTRKLGKRGYPLAPDQRSITGIAPRTSRIGQAYSSATKAAATKAATPKTSTPTIDEIEDRKIVKLATRRPAPDGGVAGAGSADSKSELRTPDGGT
jgi:putative DNA primase/helicase